MFGLKKQKISIPAPTLMGGRVMLRAPLGADFEEWRDVRLRNKEYLQPFEPLWPRDCLSREFYERRLLRQYQLWQADLSRSFLIFDQEGDQLIGGMNINNIARGASQSGALGYWLDQELQGRGLMHDAIEITLEYAFGPMRLHRVQAACIPENKRSQNCLERAGFKLEGFAEKYIEINGRWQDHILYGLPIEIYDQFERLDQSY